ncbi:MAG: hypothetical protein HY342_07060, partial [Candidatus Lambdaproteobacteria bacterium]|nr:hypothetical protein [Candidatus Lambdaproteobacteria bacterium]
EALLQEPDYLELVWPTLLDAYEADGQHSRVVTLGQDLVLTGRLQPTVGLTRRILKGYEQLGEPGMGLSLLRRLEESRSEAMSAPEMRVLLGQAEAAHGDKARALAHLQAAVAQAEKAPPPAAPEYYFQAHATLHGLLTEKGDHAAASAHAFRAAERAGTPEQQALAARWLGAAYAGWGRQALGARQPAAAMHRLAVALAFLPQDPPAPRAEAVDALARLLARDNPTLGTQRYQRELIQAEHPAYRERLRAGLQALYLEWAEHAKQAGNVTQAIAQYRNALQDMPGNHWRERYAMAVQLDTLYQAQGDYAGRVGLYEEFTGDAVPADLRERLRLYQSQLYREWGDADAAAGHLDKALHRYRRGLARLTPQDQQWRFDLVVAMGRLHERQGRFGDAVLLYERELPRLGGGPTMRRLREETGRLYVAWGKQAEKQNNSRSARIRYYYALDNLAADDWRSRLAAVVPLAQLLEADDKAEEAAGLFATLVPTIDDTPTRQRYALYLGRVYQEKLNRSDDARRWLEQGTAGPTRLDAIEAGYLLAELDVAQAAPQAARDRLAALAAAGVTDTSWAVPIHYRLAVLLHEDKQLEQALHHYRIVAGVEDAKLRKLYARPIAQARQQAEAIGSYLRLQGGRSDISVPTVKSAR